MPGYRFIHIQHSIAVELPTGSAMPIRSIIGIGRNYKAHAEEQGAELPTLPMVFTKNPASACLDGDDIVIPDICKDPTLAGGDAVGANQVDYEAELAVVLGEAARDVSEADALSYVLGYCCANDVSARWWQKQGSGGQFCRGKSFDTFCPLGPALVPATQVPDPQNLTITCHLNDTLVQESSTAMMIFPITKLISDLSQGTTLLPGTVILTGTPSGTGMAQSPPRWLTPGDKVSVQIQSLGKLTNRVR